MYSPLSLAELSCIIRTNPLMQLGGESLASEVAIRHSTGFSKVFEYLSEKKPKDDKHLITKCAEIHSGTSSTHVF